MHYLEIKFDITKVLTLHQFIKYLKKLAKMNNQNMYLSPPPKKNCAKIKPKGLIIIIILDLFKNECLFGSMCIEGLTFILCIVELTG